MAIGSAIASVAGGVMKMSAAKKQAKAAQEAGQMSEEQMQAAMAAIKEYGAKSIDALSEQYGISKEAMTEFFTQAEGALGKHYDQALGDIKEQYGKAGDTLEDKYGQAGDTLKENYGEGQMNLKEQFGLAQGKLGEATQAWEDQMGYAASFQDTLKNLGEEYGEYASQMYQDWETQFGSMEKNLTDYYNNLDPTKYSVAAKAEIGQEMQKATKQFNETAAQSGIYTSGMKLQNEKENQFKQAQAFSQADLSAPEMVNQMKQGYYAQFGQGQKQNAQNAQQNAFQFNSNLANQGYGAVQGATQGYGNALGNQATLYGQLGQNQANMNAQLGNNLGNYQAQLGNNLSNYQTQLGNRLGNMGENQAGRYSNLYNQQGMNLANLSQQFGRDQSNVYNNMGYQLSGNATGAADRYAKSAAGYGTAAGQNAGGGMSMIGNGISDLSGMLGDGGGGVMDLFSDIRLKTNIKRLGTSRNGFNTYSWDWTPLGLELAGDTPSEGVIAQEVQQTRPDLISRHSSGYLMVNYKGV